MNDISQHGSVDLENGSIRPPTQFPRLIRRDLPFYQSKNKVAISHNASKGRLWQIVSHDWFHVLLRLPLKVSIGGLLTLWTGAIIFFACLYMIFDALNTQPECYMGTDPDTNFAFGAAFAFSLETCTTVGYGLPSGTNAFFEKCQGLQFIAYLQQLYSMLFNAFFLSFLVNRLARSEARFAQVVNSNKAIVTLAEAQVASHEPQLRLQFRLFDMDARHPVVEAHVRCYVIMKRRPIPRPLRLLQPDDELGAMLFLSFPSVVSHHIDVYSMLHPPTAKVPTAPSGLNLRQVDSTTASREEIVCPVCGEIFGTHQRWVKHVKYYQREEERDLLEAEAAQNSVDSEVQQEETIYCPVCADSFTKHEHFVKHVRYHQWREKDDKDHPCSHCRISDILLEPPMRIKPKAKTKSPAPKQRPLKRVSSSRRIFKHHLDLTKEDLQKPQPVSIDEIRDYFEKEVAEIICVVEGIDPLLSGTFQSLHSYSADDIVWDPTARFAPCVKVDPYVKGEAGVQVDLDRFHVVETGPSMTTSTMFGTQAAALEKTVDDLLEEEDDDDKDDDVVQTIKSDETCDEGEDAPTSLDEVTKSLPRRKKPTRLRQMSPRVHDRLFEDDTEPTPKMSNRTEAEVPVEAARSLPADPVALESVTESVVNLMKQTSSRRHDSFFVEEDETR